MSLPASDSETGTLSDKKGRSAKAKRGAKKASAGSRDASIKRKRKRVGTPAPAAASSVASGGKPAAAPPPCDTTHRETEPPALATTVTPSASKGRDEMGPTGPMVSGPTITPTGERRRWPERHGPAAHGEAGEPGDAPPRVNKLLPTNAVHPTERRIKRRLHKNGAFLAAAAAALLGVLILTNQSEPPEMVINERQLASRLPTGQDWQSDDGADSQTVSEAPTRGLEPRVGTTETPATKVSPAAETRAAATLRTATPPVGRSKELNVGEVFEMQRLLSRLDLANDEPNGIIGEDTADAIRAYQQIAGLPVDGEVSQDLLADMREVVKILDGGN
jgi:peptidoglycan hydrolase-like protein with peptidoglycan-binding domain